jgi:hypothetical protein
MRNFFLKVSVSKKQDEKRQKENFTIDTDEIITKEKMNDVRCTHVMSSSNFIETRKK